MELNPATLHHNRLLFLETAHACRSRQGLSYFRSEVWCGFTEPTRSRGRNLNHCLCKLLFSVNTEHLFYHQINEGEGSEGVTWSTFLPLKCRHYSCTQWGRFPVPTHLENTAAQGKASTCTPYQVRVQRRWEEPTHPHHLIWSLRKKPASQQAGGQAAPRGIRKPHLLHSSSLTTNHEGPGWAGAEWNAAEFWRTDTLS